MCCSALRSCGISQALVKTHLPLDLVHELVLLAQLLAHVGGDVAHAPHAALDLIEHRVLLHLAVLKLLPERRVLLRVLVVRRVAVGAAHVAHLDAHFARLGAAKHTALALRRAGLHARSGPHTVPACVRAGRKKLGCGVVRAEQGGYPPFFGPR